MAQAAAARQFGSARFRRCQQASERRCPPMTIDHNEQTASELSGVTDLAAAAVWPGRAKAKGQVHCAIAMAGGTAARQFARSMADEAWATKPRQLEQIGGACSEALGRAGRADGRG